MTTEGSPINTQGETATSIKSEFDNGKIYLLTFKSKTTKLRHQQIGFLSDRLKKISKTYLVVRETNKQDDKYHFHAVYKSTKHPPKSWFIKGVHMDVRKVGEYEHKAFPIEDFTAWSFNKQEHEDMIHYGEMTSKDLNKLKLQRRLNQVITRHLARKDHIDRVYAYITKELEKPKQYTNYILSIRGIMKKLNYQLSPSMSCPLALP